MGAADHRALPRRAARPTRWRPTSASARGSPTTSGSSPARGCRSSSARSSRQDPRAARGAAPGTCRRWRPSSSAATTEIAALAELLARPAARRGRRPRRHRQDGARDRDRPRARRGDGVWLVRLEAARDRRRGARRRDRRARASPAARRRCSSGSGARRRCSILDNCEHVRRRGRGARRSACSTPRPALRILAHEPGRRSSVDGEAVLELAPLALDDAVELFTAPRRPRRATTPRCTSCAASLDGLPLAIELAAARTRTLSVDEIARRLDDRFGVLQRPDEPQARAPPRAAGDDRLELRPAVPRRPARPVGAGHVRRRRAARRRSSRCSRRSTCRASAAIDVLGRLAEPLARDRRRRRPRYRLLDSIRAFALEAMARRGLTDRGLDAHAAWYAAAAAASTAGVRSARQAEHLAFARAERANIDAALAWSAAHDPLRALAIANGFGWAWIVLGDSRGAQRLLAALDAAGDAAPAARPRRRAAARRRGSRPRPGDLEPARRARRPRPRALARRRRRPAGALRLPPRLRRLPPRRVGAARSS